MRPETVELFGSVVGRCGFSLLISICILCYICGNMFIYILFSFQYYFRLSHEMVLLR